jgi:DNA modification methylase
MGKLDLFTSILKDKRIANRSTHQATFLFNVVGYGNDDDTIESAHCQRNLCWTYAQHQAYVTHCLETKHCGNFIIYRPQYSHVKYILDGQHRRKAWRLFVNGEIVVEKEGELIIWNDFTKDEIKKLERVLICSIDSIETKTPYDESLAEDIYNKFNFTGAKH